MRILLITLRSDMGGGPRHVRDLSQGLARAGAKVYIASPYDAPFFEEFNKLAEAHFFLPHRRFSLLRLLSLIHFCFKNKIQIVHSHGRGAGVYARLLKIFRFKVVHSFHGIHFSTGVKGLLTKWTERVFGYFTDLFVAVGENERARAIEEGLAAADKIQVVWNGIGPLSNKKLSHQNHGQVYRLGAIGRLEPEKGYDLLIETLRQSPMADICVLVAGNGSCRKQYEEQVFNCKLTNLIRFVGEVRDVSTFLSKIDAEISFSLGEGLPYSVLEALDFGIPCILSDVTGHREFKDVAGVFLFNPASVGSFFQAVEAARNYQGKISLPQKFTIENMVNSILAVYCLLLK